MRIQQSSYKSSFNSSLLILETWNHLSSFERLLLGCQYGCGPKEPHEPKNRVCAQFYCTSPFALYRITWRYYSAGELWRRCIGLLPSYRSKLCLLSNSRESSLDSEFKWYGYSSLVLFCLLLASIEIMKFSDIISSNYLRWCHYYKFICSDPAALQVVENCVRLFHKSVDLEKYVL